MQNYNLKFKNNGFAMLDIIVVVAFLVILSFFSLKYYQNLGSYQEQGVGVVGGQNNDKKITPVYKAKNADRQTDVLAIASAIKFYQVDKNGKLPTGIDKDLKAIGKATAGCDIQCGEEKITQTSCLNLELSDYLPKTLKDPAGSDENTLYAVRELDDGRIEVISCQEGIGVVR